MSAPIVTTLEVQLRYADMLEREGFHFMAAWIREFVAGERKMNEGKG